VKSLMVKDRVDLAVLLVCLSTGLPLGGGSTVEEHHGNIYLRSAKAVLEQLTDSGRDCMPSLSADDTRIVFVRNLDIPSPGSIVGDAVGPEFGRSQLWIYQTRGGTPPQLLLDSPILIKGRHFFGFYAPQFSADGNFVYFQIAFAASSAAIVRLTIVNKDVVYITDAVAFAVIPVGKYRGYLITQQHRPKLGLGYYDWYYLLSSGGQPVDVIGQDKFDVSNFLDLYVGDVNTCPAWNGPEWMTCISQIRPRAK